METLLIIFTMVFIPFVLGVVAGFKLNDMVGLAECDTVGEMMIKMVRGQVRQRRRRNKRALKTWTPIGG